MKTFFKYFLVILVILLAVFYYRLAFEFSDWGLNVITFEFWVSLLGLFMIPLILIKYEQWNWLIIYALIAVFHFFIMYYKAKGLIAERLQSIDVQHYSELYNLLDGVKILIFFVIIIFISTVFLKILDFKK